MPRARQLKYGFFINEKLAELPPLCRMFFQGLWLLADREGKLEDRPRKLKAQILPYDDADGDAFLCALKDASFLRRYEIDGASYIKILNFNEHQSPHKDEAESVIPDPVTQKHAVSTIEAPEEHQQKLPCTLYPVSCIKKEKENKLTQKKKKKDHRLKFEQFYKTYPRHKDRERARKVFEKLNPDEELFAEIMQALENQAEEHKLKNIDKQYLKYPQAWLNGKCWTDEVDMSAIEKQKQKSNPYMNCKRCGKEILKTLGLAGYCEKCDWELHPPPVLKVAAHA